MQPGAMLPVRDDPSAGTLMHDDRFRETIITMARRHDAAEPQGPTGIQ
jgi:hypothetical protein